MSNFSTIELISPASTSTAPQVFCASTPDNLATIKAAGYLNDLKSKVKANDIFNINYNDTSTFPLNVGLTADSIILKVSYSASNWSLVDDIIPADLKLTHNHIYIGGTDDTAVDAPMTQDVNVVLTSGNAVSTIQPGVVDAGKLASDAVTTVKILDGNVTMAKLAPNIQYLYRIVGGVQQADISTNGANVFAISPAVVGDGVSVTVNNPGASGPTVLWAAVTGQGQVTVTTDKASVGAIATILVVRAL